MSTESSLYRVKALIGSLDCERIKRHYDALGIRSNESVVYIRSRAEYLLAGLFDEQESTVSCCEGGFEAHRTRRSDGSWRYGIRYVIARSEEPWTELEE